MERHVEGCRYGYGAPPPYEIDLSREDDTTVVCVASFKGALVVAHVAFKKAA